MSPAPSRQFFWIPTANVFISQSGQLIIQLDLSGMQSADLEVISDGDKLRITGHRRNSEVAAAKAILINEIAAGPFESVLELPSGFDMAQATCTYSGGVLRVIVPQKAPA